MILELYEEYGAQDQKVGNYSGPYSDVVLHRIEIGIARA